MYLCQVPSPPYFLVAVDKTFKFVVPGTRTFGTDFMLCVSSRHTAHQISHHHTYNIFGFRQLLLVLLLILSMFSSASGQQTISTFTPPHSASGGGGEVDQSTGGHPDSVSSTDNMTVTPLEPMPLTTANLTSSNVTEEKLLSCSLDTNSTMCQGIGLLLYPSLSDTTLLVNSHGQCPDLHTSYYKFVDVLGKYNCRANYTYMYSLNVNCEQCLDTYRQWLCSINGYYNYSGNLIPPCRAISCNRVRRACPYLHPEIHGLDYASEPGFLCTIYPGDEEGSDISPCYFFSDSNNNLLPANAAYSCNDTHNPDICVLTSRAAFSNLYSGISNRMLIFISVICYQLYS